MSGEQQYACPVAQIRCMENRLLSKATLDHIIEAENVIDGISVLAENGYPSLNLSPDVQEQDAVRSYVDELESQPFKIAWEIRKISPEPSILDIFIAKCDFHNAKVCVKSNLSDKELTENDLSPYGNVKPKKLLTSFVENTLSSYGSEVPSALAGAIDAAVSVVAQTGYTSWGDIIIDKGYFLHMQRVSSKLECDSTRQFLNELLEIMGDSANIRTYLRIRNMKTSDDQLLMENAYVVGKIPCDEFIHALQSDDINLQSILRGRPFADMFLQDHTGDGSAKDIVTLEKASDDFITEYLQKKKTNPFGAESILAYVWAKKMEIMNVRLILLAKINNLPMSYVVSRIRKLMV